jgi:hypothetical protein
VLLHVGVSPLLRTAGELLGSCQFGRCVKVVSRRAAPPCNIAPIGRVSDTAKRLSKYMPLRGLRCTSRADTTLIFDRRAKFLLIRAC